MNVYAAGMICATATVITAMITITLVHTSKQPVTLDEETLAYIKRFQPDSFSAEGYCDERFPTKLPNGTLPLGFYQPDQYFCVRTHGRTEAEIMATVAHEMAHLENHRYPEHYGVQQ